MINLLFKGAQGYAKHYNGHIINTVKEYGDDTANRLLKNMPNGFERTTKVEEKKVVKEEVKENKMVVPVENKSEEVSSDDKPENDKSDLAKVVEASKKRQGKRKLFGK